MSTTHRDELSLRVRDLWQAVTELTVIAFEDRPHDLDLIAVDELCDRVSDLQGQVHALQGACAGHDDPGESLPAIGELLEQAGTTYWRELRCGRPLAELTVTGRRRNDEFTAWAQSLGACLQHCEEPLLQATAAWRLAWPELLRGRTSRHLAQIALIDTDVRLNTTVEVPR